MEAAQKAGFHYARGDLGRPDHHAGEHRLRRRRAERFDDPRQMRRHRRGHRPGGGERERQQHHRPIDRNVRLDCGPFGGGDPLRPRQQKIERQADHDVRDRPRVAGLSPADRLKPERAQRPADRAGEARDQRDAGDRRSRVAAVDAAQRAERRIVEAEAHADAEQQPGRRHHPERGRCAKQREPRRENDVGGAENLPSADAIDLPPDPRAEQSGNHQRSRERGEEPVARDPEVARDRIGQDGRQIVA